MVSVGIVSLYVVAWVDIKLMGPATSIIRISLLLISIIINSIKMAEIETDGTINTLPFEIILCKLLLDFGSFNDFSSG